MIGSTIQRELAMMLLREINDPRLDPAAVPSITRVKVSPDLSVADVYVTVMGTPGQQSAALAALRHSGGMMRARLTKVMALRVAPFLKFHLDEDLRRELELLDVLQKVHDEQEALDRERAARAPTTDDVHVGGTAPAADAANSPGTTRATRADAGSTNLDCDKTE